MKILKKIKYLQILNYIVIILDFINLYYFGLYYYFYQNRHPEILFYFRTSLIDIILLLISYIFLILLLIINNNKIYVFIIALFLVVLQILVSIIIGQGLQFSFLLFHILALFIGWVAARSSRNRTLKFPL